MNIPSEIKPPLLNQWFTDKLSTSYFFFLQKERSRHLFFFSREYNSLFGYYYICNNDNSFFACVHHHGQIWWRGKKWWNTGCLFCFLFFLVLVLFVFSCQKVPIDFSNFHNFFDRDHYRGLKNSFFSFSQHCGFCLFVFVLWRRTLKQAMRVGAQSRNLFFSFSSGHHKINRWAWLGNLYGCPAHFSFFFL